MENNEQQRQFHELVEAIMKAVPWKLSDKDGLSFVKRIHHDDQVLEQPNRPITLEDVLLAIATGRELWAVTPLGQFVYIDKSNLSTRLATCVWLLGKPLSDQSDECKKFLHSLLKE